MSVGGEGIPRVCSGVGNFSAGVCGGIASLGKRILGGAQDPIRLQGGEQGFNGLGLWVVSVGEVMGFKRQLNGCCSGSHIGFLSLGSNE